MKETGKKRLTAAMKSVLAISLIPWIFTLGVAVYAFFAGTTTGLFQSATEIYGVNAFAFTVSLYFFVFMPVYVITALTALACTIVLIRLRKTDRRESKTPKVVMTCGRICSGKSTYAQKLRKEIGAVVLSVDEITLALFGQDAGDKHDGYVEKTEEYLFKKSVEIVETGISVILDWGFWQRSEREYARNFYGSRGIPCELHYIDIDENEWQRRLEKRNSDVNAGKCSAYYVDEGLADKFGKMFETPDADETDVTVSA